MTFSYKTAKAGRSMFTPVPDARGGKDGSRSQYGEWEEPSGSREPSRPQFGLEATNRNWVDKGSAEHLVKDYTQRNPGTTKDEQSLDYWQKRAGVKQISRQEDIAQIERTMRNRERELEIKAQQKRDANAAKASSAPAAAAPQAELKPFNPADYAPKKEEEKTPEKKEPSQFLEDTLNSLNSNTQKSSYQQFTDQVKQRDEAISSGKISYLAPLGAEKAPAKTDDTPEWMKFAASFGYGPKGNVLPSGGSAAQPKPANEATQTRSGRKAASGKFLDQLRSF